MVMRICAHIAMMMRNLLMVLVTHTWIGGVNVDGGSFSASKYMLAFFCISIQHECRKLNVENDCIFSVYYI